MQRTNIIKLKPNKLQKKILQECMILSSCVYNMANYEVRQSFFKKEKSPSFFDLQQKLQNKDDYKVLGRSYALPRIQVYGETNSARFKLIKAKVQNKVGLPKYFKNRKTNTTIPSYLVIDGCQYGIKKNHIEIPLSRKMRKKYQIGQTFKINYNGILKWKGSQKRGQIHFKDNKFYFYQSVELKDVVIKKNKIKAGLDLGIKKLFALYINNGKDKLIGSNRFFKQWSYYTNLISKEQSILNLKNKRISNKLKKLFLLRSRWQENLFNNLVAKLFRVLNKNKVSQLIVGDVKHIRDDNSKGKKLNKMIHNYWSFDLIFKKIKNKCQEFGIDLVRETEEYTSQTCPICSIRNKNNKKDRIFLCDFCGYINHRDIVGARNILTKNMYGSITSIHWNEIVPLEVLS